MTQAILILSGGDATRLDCKGPKGCVEIAPGLTLFQNILRKCPKGAPVFIMASPKNYDAVCEGTKEFNVTVFKQHLRNGFPNGNGEALKLLYELDEFENIESICVVPIDNPLAIPQISIRDGEDLVVKVILRDPNIDNVGRVHIKDKKLRIIEYTEADENTKYGYSGMFAISKKWLSKIHDVDLPDHIINKKGSIRHEKFIFDVFPYADTFRLEQIERDKEFYPIKTKENLDHIFPFNAP